LREQRDLAARDALERAAALAPDWAAVHYESGKLWLALDDTMRARDAFAKAGELMPTFSAAFSNLGATLGELDDPARALAAFEQALAHDPRSFTILNNVGVVNRELGRLDASEAAFRQVVAIAPAFVFGHYNLGHTLFLAGKYGEALAAYEEGQRRDPDKSRRQACRLAVMRLANGDVAGAERDLYRCADAAPADEREDLLLEAFEIAQALIAHDPVRAADVAQRQFLDRLGSQIVKSE
jgi:tetratricopeptide (TPR) repeat protein